MQDDSTGPRVTRDAMVLESDGSLDQGTPTAPSLEDTTETATFQQVPQQCGEPEPTSEVAERIKAPQRESSRKVYQSKWFMGNGAHRVRWTSPQQLFPR